MRKLLRKKDIFFLTLAGIGDAFVEIRDPLRLVGGAYRNMYGFIPKQYKRHNFSMLIGRSLKTGHIERIVKNNHAYLKLTSFGKEYIQREFPIVSLVKHWNKKWILVIFDIKEVSRKQRNRLRNALKNIGFGMLQQSVWITPLPIGEDIREFISHQGFSGNVFVLEISHVLLGDPKVLATRVWGLDQLEEDYLKLIGEKKRLIGSIQNTDGRHSKGYEIAKQEKKEEEMRRQKKGILEFLMTLPPLPAELYPASLRKARLF